MERQLDFFQTHSYHNSIAIHDEEELQVQEDRNLKQEEKILWLFMRNPNTEYTAWDVCGELNHRWPKGSVQRGITNICDHNRGKIVMTGNKKVGEFKDRPKVNTWKLKP